MCRVPAPGFLWGHADWVSIVFKAKNSDLSFAWFQKQKIWQVIQAFVALFLPRDLTRYGIRRYALFVFLQAKTGKDVRISDPIFPTSLGFFRWGLNHADPTHKGWSWTRCNPLIGWKNLHFTTTWHKTNKRNSFIKDTNCWMSAVLVLRVCVTFIFVITQGRHSTTVTSCHCVADGFIAIQLIRHLSDKDGWLWKCNRDRGLPYQTAPNPSVPSWTPWWKRGLCLEEKPVTSMKICFPVI